MNQIGIQNKIEFFGTGREFAAHKEEFSKIILDSISSGQFLQGKEVGLLEEKMAEYTRRKFAVAVNSCTDALYYALIAAGIKPGDHVMVTDFSFIASASCILRAQAVPVFVDINESYLMNLDKAQKQITPKVKALIYVHLYGQMGDPDAVTQFCVKNNLILIEDAAQAIGASYHATRAGSTGLASCISFDPTKPISAPGSGGIVLTDDKNFSDHVKRLRYHGRGEDKVRFMELGFNSQMPTSTAALLLEKLKYLTDWTDTRREIANTLTKQLSKIEKLILPKELVSQSHIYHKYVLRTPNRDALKNYLQGEGIETMIHYQYPLHRHPCFSLFDIDDSLYPNTIRYSKEVLSLPIHPFITKDEINRMVKAISNFFKLSMGIA